MHHINRINENDVCEKIIEYGLFFLIIFTPLAFGSVHVWAYTIMEAVVLLLLLIRLLAPRSSLLAPRPWLLALCLFFCLILFQLVPLPAKAIKHLSPKTYSLYRQTLGNGIKQGARNEKRDPSSAPRSSNLAPRSSRFSSLLPPPFLPPPDAISLSSPPRSLVLESRTSFFGARPLTIFGHATKTEFLKFFIYFSVFFLIITTITTSRQIRRMALTIIFTGTGVAFLAILQMLGKSDKIYGFWQSQYKIGSYGGPFINANHLAGYLEMVIPLALGFLISRQVPGIIRTAKNWKQQLSLLESWFAKNILLVFIIVLMASALFLSVSRGGILSFVFSLGLFSLLLGFRKSHQGKRKIILLISGLIFICLVWMGVGPVVAELSTLAKPKTALAGRLQVWKDTLVLSRDFPLFGVGLGNFQNLYPAYTTLASSTTFWEHAHNDYIEMLADTGWVGLFLFFGGIWLILFTIIKRWRQIRDPFLAGIALGGFIGAVSLLCHCLVEFNFHIPADAFLFFVILGLSVVAVNQNIRGEEESPPLPARQVFLSPYIKKTVTVVKALMVVFLLALVMKDYLAYHFFMNYRSWSRAASPPASRSPFLVPLTRAIFLDSGNAEYHYALGNYYTQKMGESWKQAAWSLQEDHWVSDNEKNIRSFGLKALQSYTDAVNLSPTNSGYHFYRGWILRELKRFSEFSLHSIPVLKTCKAEAEFSCALMLDPNNDDIKKYIQIPKGKP